MLALLPLVKMDPQMAPTNQKKIQMVNNMKHIIKIRLIKRRSLKMKLKLSEERIVKKNLSYSKPLFSRERKRINSKNKKKKKKKQKSLKNRHSKN